MVSGFDTAKWYRGSVQIAWPQSAKSRKGVSTRATKRIKTRRYFSHCAAAATVQFDFGRGVRDRARGGRAQVLEQQRHERGALRGRDLGALELREEQVVGELEICAG